MTTGVGDDEIGAGGLGATRPSSINLDITADLPFVRPLPTFRSSFNASFSGILMLMIRLSPARCLAMDYTG